jgi:UDP-glucose 4-epimerase
MTTGLRPGAGAAAAAAFTGKRALVTGGLGFIGSTLALRLLDLGAEVTVVDSLVPEYGGNLFNVAGREASLRINISDVRDPHSFRHLIQGQDYLFNLAGQTAHQDSMLDPFTDLEINARAQLSMLESCRAWNPGVRILFASTRQVYGRPAALPVGEDHATHPVDINGVHKLAGESYHRLYHEVHGIRSAVLRLTNTIGPRMRVRDARQTFLGLWIREVLEGRPVEVWGGTQTRDFTYVDDAVDAFIAVAVTETAFGRILNVGGCPPVSLLELARLLCGLREGASFEVRPFPPEHQAIDIGDYYADDSALRGLTGWAPATPLDEALRRTLDWYASHLPRYTGATAALPRHIR